MARDTIVFVFNKIDCELVKDMIRDKHLDSNKALLILFSKSFEDHFIMTDIKYAFFESYLKKMDFTNDNKKLLDFIKKFPHEKVLFGKSLVELLEYKGCSLWWFVRQGFYAHCLEAFRKVDTIRFIIKYKKIKKIIIVNPDKINLELIRQSSKKAEILIIRKNARVTGFDYHFLANEFNLFLDYIPRIIRVFQGFIRSFFYCENENKKNVLVFTQAHVWTRITNDIEGDSNTYAIIRELRNSDKYNVITLDAAISAESAWNAIKKKKNPFLPYEFFLVKSYLNYNISRRLKDQKLHLEKLWHTLGKKIIFKRLFIYDDIALYPLIYDKLKGYFFNNFHSFISAARNLETGESIIAKYNLDYLILVDENGSSRFLVYAAKLKGVRTLGIQHGIIANWSVSYNYSKNDLFGCKNRLNCPLTDNTAVFGKHFKDILINEGNYQYDGPIITGQSKTDIFYENKSRYSKKDLCLTLGINIQKKIVVFASQPLPDLNESKLTLSLIVEVLRDFPETELVIKIHPNDNESNYKSILNHYNYNATIIKEFDIYWLISCSEFLISISSTVLLETLMLNKPAIQINLVNNYDLLDGKNPKSLIKVHNKKELNTCIAHLLKDKELISKQSEETKNFISEYFYKLDGECTKRVLKIVEKQITRQK